MGTPIRLATLAAGAAVAAALLGTFMPASGQAQSSAMPRAADGKPDFTGIWQAMNTANWDLQAHEARHGPVVALGAAFSVPAGTGIVEGNEIPYLPPAAATKKENRENWLARDPEIKCYLPGVPRMMYMPYPVQVVQSSSTIVMMSEFASAIRTIYMNSTTRPPADTWMGWSNGKWDGDTLVIDSKGFMGGTIGALDPEGTIHVRFLDRAGNYHTDGLHVVERIRRTDADHLSYQATIEDPNVYTRPWTISMPLYRRVEPNMQLGDFKCEEFVGDLVYGKYQRK